MGIEFIYSHGECSKPDASGPPSEDSSPIKISETDSRIDEKIAPNIWDNWKKINIRWMPNSNLWVVRGVVLFWKTTCNHLQQIQISCPGDDPAVTQLYPQNVGLVTWTQPFEFGSRVHSLTGPQRYVTASRRIARWMPKFQQINRENYVPFLGGFLKNHPKIGLTKMPLCLLRKHVFCFWVMFQKNLVYKKICHVFFFRKPWG